MSKKERRMSASRRLSIQNALVESLMEEIREKQMLKMSNDINAYHFEDVYAIRSNDWVIKRFVLEYRCDKDDALLALDKALRWRKSSGIALARLRDFPRELVRNELITFGTNVKGYKVMYFRVKLLGQTGLTDLHLSDLVVKWALFLISNYESEPEGLGLVFDFTDASVIRLQDTATVIKIITAVTSYMPLGLKFTWILDAPLLHRPFLNAILVREKDQRLLSLMPKEEALELLGADFAPKFIGGLADTKEAASLPRNSTSLERRSSTLVM